MSARIRWAVAAASAGLGLAVGLALSAREEPAESVALDGDGSELRSLLDQRRLDVETRRAPSAPHLLPLAGPMSLEDAQRVFATLSAGDVVFDEVIYYRRMPDLARRGRWSLVTNDQGFREDAPLPASPDRRVLVIGDSHTDGVCENHQSFANLLEASLAERHAGLVIDVVNAGCGGYSFYNYLRGLDLYVEELDVDVYVCAVYGGNDFLEVVGPWHYFQRTRMPRGDRTYGERVDAFKRATGDAFGRYFAQAGQQLAFLTQIREDELRTLVDATAALTRAMAERAAELGVELVMVYVPPMWDMQLERYADDPQELRDALVRADGTPVGDASAWVDPWIETVRELGLPLIDLRADWTAADVDLYWQFDHHINLEGHRRIAEALLPVVEPLLDL